MLIEGVFVDVKTKLTVKIAEEAHTHIVTLVDDDRVLLRELIEVGEGRTEHRVSRYIATASTLIELLQIGLYGRNITQYATFWKIR